MTENLKSKALQALIPIGVLVVLLVLNVVYFKDDSSYGPNQIALLLSAAVGAMLAYRNGLTWKATLEGMLKSINHAMPSILILLLIGALAGTWLISGIVPAMIYYGLYILTPKVFLVAACIVCMIVSLATGSSWSTAATVGVALMGIGGALGIHEGLVAGAIISGAYFGDKMSPLSDTTNLAPAMAGTDLFTHIRYMLVTTVPSITIALILFAILGLTADSSVTSNDISEVQSSIQRTFNLSPLLFIVPAAVIYMIVKRVPALPALLVGVLLAAACAVIFQGFLNESNLLMQISPISAEEGKSVWEHYYAVVIQAMYGDIAIPSENVMVGNLLSSGGMMGMMFVILLILAAMVFGGVMEAAGYLQALVLVIVRGVEKTFTLVASTVGTCMFFNLTASEQYVSLVIPGRMYSEIYKKKGLPPELLSRTLEDSGTVTSVLIPWNSCGYTTKVYLG